MYSPAEDSYFLSEEIKKHLSKIKNADLKQLKVLDMGSGSGIQAETCIVSGINKANITCVDIDGKVIKHLKSKGLKTKKRNIFSNLNKKSKFDLITFNPPYLPEDPYDKQIDTTAGKNGYELILKFLKQAKTHLNKNGTILLLISSLSKPLIIKKEAKKLDYKLAVIKEKKLFFEKLFVLELKL